MGRVRTRRGVENVTCGRVTGTAVHLARAVAVPFGSAIAAAGLAWLCVDAWQTVTRAPEPSFDHLLGAVTATGACLVMAWCALVVMLVALGSLPGRLGVVAAIIARGVAPVAARRRAGVVLGVAVVTAQVGLAVSATAAPAPPTASAGPVVTSAVDDLPPIGRPPVPPPSVVVPPDDPADPTTDPAPPREPRGSTPASPPAGPERDPAQVTVEPGDTLWSIAAAHLDDDATTAEVARTWPMWFAANRDVVGADPDLIRPGTVLVEPAPLADRSER